MKLKTSERGFTLVELVVGITIAAIVVGAASMTTITMMRLTPRNNDWAVALRQVQNAGHWISHDIQMSQGDITVGDGNPTFLTLTVPEWEGGLTVTTVAYEFEDMPGGLNRLMRNNQTAVEETVIAENISSDETTATYYGPDDPDNPNTLTFTITAVSGTVPPVSRDYEAMQRVPPAPAEEP